MPLTDDLPSRGPDRKAALVQYKEASLGYDRHMRPFARLQRAAVKRLDLGSGHTVIDVACGTGINFPLLEERIGPQGKIIGIDLSPEMLAQARDRVSAAGWENVELIEAPVEDAHLHELGDAALFSFTHDVLQSRVALANIVVHLRPGARVASVGAKLSGRWNFLVNFFVRRAAKQYVTTFSGLRKPWALLEDYVPELESRTRAFGGAHLAWGSVSEKGIDRASDEHKGGHRGAR
jgi:ubiquinone/menaquinone biosynthesis C-methylase UbiE